jgi:hypothetical protein
MKIRVQLVVCDDDGHEETFTDVAVLEKACQRIDHLGLTLPEAKQILAALQQRLVAQQTLAFVAARSQCQHCGKSLGIKGYHTRTFRTLFGTVTLTSPRLYHCRCQRRETATFRPLNALLTEAVAPELLFMETKWASLVSYGLTAQALKDFLPVNATLNATTVQNHTLAVAQRCEDELGEEQWAFVEGCPADWETLPIPDGPLTVGIDGGYVRHWEEKQQHFEVIVGKSILAFKRDDNQDIPSSKCFGFVQTLDKKPKRRLFEVLKSQGLQMNQQLTFLSDGGDTVRDLQLYLSPEAEHLLDWFHLSMRLTVMEQSAKSLPLTIQDEEETFVLRDAVLRELERLKWFFGMGTCIGRSRWWSRSRWTSTRRPRLAMAPHGNSSKPWRSFTRILTAIAPSYPTMASDIGTGSASAPALSNPRSTKSSAGASANASRCSGANVGRICCSKRGSRRSMVNWGRCSSAGIPICS